MKKTILILGIIGIVAACNNSPEPVQPLDNPTTTENKNNTPSDAAAEEGLELIAQSDCLTCHKVADNLVGPSYESIAEKYQNESEVLDTLASRVINGSQGIWGQVPMTAHPNLSMEDARKMVKYVLSLK